MTLFLLLLHLSIVFSLGGSATGKVCGNKNTELPRGAADSEFGSPPGMSTIQQQFNMDMTQFKNPQVLKEVPLQDVRLVPGSIHYRAQSTNLEYLAMLDADRLVYSFRNVARLPVKGKPYGGWEDPGCDLRGHFVGHYLSATAKAWASTGSETIKHKMTAVVQVLYECQKEIGTGYLSAFPAEQFDRFEQLKPCWAPYYTIHKIMTGLLDQYQFAGNSQALNMTKWMAGYFYQRVQNVIAKYSIQRHYLSLNEEPGGMNEVLYRLYSITKDPKNVMLGRLFDKPCFLGELAVQSDDMAGLHANTHLALVLGSQQLYEVSGDPLYKSMATFFMDRMNASYTYVTGGTGLREHWTDPQRLATSLGSDTGESCATYNILKISRNLFRWTKEAKYADYYERTNVNGVLSIQRGTDPGVMIYFFPVGRGVSKAVNQHGWGTPFDTFWCCYGTGVESFSKLGDSIYFEEEGKVPVLYIASYISSTLDWKSANLFLNQTVQPVVSWDPFIRVILTISSKEGASPAAILNMKIPIWTLTKGVKADVNGENLAVPAPGNFLSVNRQWENGDRLTLQLPITLKLEPIKDDRPAYASFQAILYGPYLLAAYSEGDCDIKTGSTDSSSSLITPIPATHNAQLATFSQHYANFSFAILNKNQKLTMKNLPKLGTNAAVQATFRLMTDGQISSIMDAIGKQVAIEPFDHPGMFLTAQGTDLVFLHPSNGVAPSFDLVRGLDGKKGSVSFESRTRKGCYIFSDLKYKSSLRLKLKCRTDWLGNRLIKKGASFVMSKGLAEYNPISFVAKGLNRNFVLAPVFSFRDEFYTIYFNVHD